MAGNSCGNLLRVGNKMLKLKGLADMDSSKGDELILVIMPRSAANDYEAGSSQDKSRDLKYTQSKWCPMGITKTHKRKRLRDVSFDKGRPMMPSKVWVPKPTELIAPASAVPKSAA